MLLQVWGNDTATMTLGFGNIFFRNLLQSEQIIFNLFELSHPVTAQAVDLYEPQKRNIVDISFYIQSMIKKFLVARSLSTQKPDILVAPLKMIYT